MNCATLAGHAVLLAEDEPLIALDVADLLRVAGGIVAGPFRSVDEALASVSHQMPSAAVIDFRLCDGPAIPVADMLASKGVPFVWLTAFSRSMLPEQHRNQPIVSKPFSSVTLLETLASIVATAGPPNGSAEAGKTCPLPALPAVPAKELGRPGTNVTDVS